jgi:hypothetical protein
MLGPNRFVSAAQVFRVDYPSVISGIKIRDHSGKIFTPTQVTRYGGFSNLIEFQIEAPDAGVTPLVEAKEISAGQNVFSAGYMDATGVGFIPSQTLPLFPEGIEGKWKYIRFVAPRLGKYIGSPLVNEAGEVEGVVIARNAQVRLNFAVPISVLEALPTDRAEFSRKKIQFRALPTSVIKDWEFSAPLPKNLEELTLQGREAFLDFFNRSYTEILNDPSKFPKNAGFRSYTRNQQIGADIGYMQSDHYGAQWRPRWFKADQNVKEAKGTLTPVIIRAEGNVADFNKDPTVVANALIKSNALHSLSKYGNAFLKQVTNPDEVGGGADHLGRQWIAARWSDHDHDLALSTLCTPVPVGSACLVRIAPYHDIALEWNFETRFVDEVMVSYHGTLDEWKNYLTQTSPTLLPQALKNLQIDYVKGNRVDFASDKYTFHFPSTAVDGDSKIFLKMGYDPNQELGSQIIRTELFASSDEREWVGLETRFAPTDSDSHEAKAKWKKLTKNHFPYDGTPDVRKGEEKRIMKVLKVEQPRESVGAQALLAVCEVPKTRTPEELSRTCNIFIQSIKQP